MKFITLACVLGLASIPLVSCAKEERKPVATSSCAQSLLPIDGNQVWVNKEGAGSLTVVFESGFGNDSGVWSQIAPKVRAAGVQTFVYDRAGMGKGTINTASPYSLDNDLHILRTALAICGIDGPLLMVGHSYGGAISLLFASEDKRIKGLVLLDAVVPGVWPKIELGKNMQLMRGSYREILEQAPDLAKVAIPFAESMPDTAKKVDGLRIPDALPVTDIVAEKGQNSPESTQVWRAAHQKLTANNPHREYILAAGSSHKVMADKPDLVVEAIVKMIDKTKQL